MAEGSGVRRYSTPAGLVFDITVVSEIMAVLMLATSLPVLREKHGEMVIGCSNAGDPDTTGPVQPSQGLSQLLGARQVDQGMQPHEMFPLPRQFLLGVCEDGNHLRILSVQARSSI